MYCTSNLVFKILEAVHFYYFRLFVKSGGGKSSVTLRDSKLNKLFKVVEFFYL